VYRKRFLVTEERYKFITVTSKESIVVFYSAGFTQNNMLAIRLYMY
jgi:hypothetical protein